MLCNVICNVSNYTGDAQVTMNRNKIKHIYDFTADLEWKLESNFGNISGSVRVDDITADKEYEINIQVSCIYVSIYINISTLY
jgi:activator of HSP90 ATPase